MYFDSEMILIYAISILSGILFYCIASGNPGNENAGEGNLCDSPQ